jgi:hypothetical protein
MRLADQGVQISQAIVDLRIDAKERRFECVLVVVFGFRPENARTLGWGRWGGGPQVGETERGIRSS